MPFSQEFSPEEYCRLRVECGWPELPLEQAAEGLKHSSFLAAFMRCGRVVGCCRVVWDHGYITYFSDLMVQSDFRGKGIGKALTRRALVWIGKQLKPGWKIKVVLISTPGNESFYENLGFKRRPSANMGAGMDMWLEGGDKVSD